MLLDTGKHYTVAILDKSGIVADSLHATSRLTYIKEQDSTTDIQHYLQAHDYEGIVIVGANIIENPKDITLYSLRTIAQEATESVEKDINSIVRNARLARFQIEGLDEVLASAKMKIDIRSVILDETGTEKETNSAISLILGYILGGLVYTLIAASGAMVMSGVIEEKNNRIVEVLVSSVRSFDLMLGKILGVASVFLIQLVLWLVVTFALVTVAGQLFHFGSSPQEISQLTSSLDVTGTSNTLTSKFATNGVQDILRPLESIHFGQLLVVFFFFFFGGYFLYAALYAAIGSAVEEASDAQQLIIPITVPLMISFFVLFLVGRSPDGALAFWFSMIPFTAPIIMPARVAYGVETWELLVSGTLLFLSFIGTTWLAAKVYRNGILQYGKKFGWGDILKWLKH